MNTKCCKPKSCSTEARKADAERALRDGARKTAEGIRESAVAAKDVVKAGAKHAIGKAEEAGDRVKTAVREGMETASDKIRQGIADATDRVKEMVEK